MVGKEELDIVRIGKFTASRHEGMGEGLDQTFIVIADEDGDVWDILSHNFEGSWVDAALAEISHYEAVLAENPYAVPPAQVVHSFEEEISY
jgi:hypothetical protein